MDFNIITNNAICHQLIAAAMPLTMVYYAHIPTAIITLLVGLFVFFKNPKGLLNRILFILSLTFFLWLVGSLITWIMNYNTGLTMAYWSQLGLLNVLFFIFSLYFVYVFIDKKDISFVNKVVLGVVLLPVIILSPLKYNLSGFTMETCEAIEQNTFLNIVLYLEIFVSIWIVVFSAQRYVKADRTARRQILLLSIGLIIFLVSFFVAGYYAAYVDDFRYELYGLFGMTLFMGILAYLIVRYKAFNIKLLSAQAIVVSLVILIASQFAFIQNQTNRILTGITLFLSAILGWFLIRSVKKEVLQREQLEIANAELKKLDVAKSEFVSIASHQLRSPLTAIRGFTSMIRHGDYGPVGKKQEEPLWMVAESADRLIHLMEELLDISRIESGKTVFVFEPTQLEDLVKNVCDEIEITAKKKNISLIFEPPAKKLPLIKIDQPKIRQVVQNLIDNSVKYTQENGWVKVSLKLMGNKIWFMVLDNGVGIRAEDLPKLFAKFSRGTDMSTAHPEGCGLGLYVARQMIEAHKGRIWADSDGLGKGSRFCFEVGI